MSISEIKTAIAEGKKVCCGSSVYVVVLFPTWVSPISTGLGLSFTRRGSEGIFTYGLQFEELDDCFIFGE